jgi:hypothetical protein
MLLIGCVSVAAEGYEDGPPFPDQAYEFIAQMNREYGEPLVFEDYPVVIFKWDTGDMDVRLIMVLDFELGWIPVLLRTPSLTTSKMLGTS